MPLLRRRDNTLLQEPDVLLHRVAVKLWSQGAMFHAVLDGDWAVWFLLQQGLIEDPCWIGNWRRRVFLTLFEMSPMVMVMVMMMLDVYLVLCMLFALLRVNSRSQGTHPSISRSLPRSLS